MAPTTALPPRAPSRRRRGARVVTYNARVSTHCSAAAGTRTVSHRKDFTVRVSISLHECSFCKGNPIRLPLVVLNDRCLVVKERNTSIMLINLPSFMLFSTWICHVSQESSCSKHVLPSVGQALSNWTLDPYLGEMAHIIHMPK